MNVYVHNVSLIKQWKFWFEIVVSREGPNNIDIFLNKLLYKNLCRCETISISKVNNFYFIFSFISETFHSLNEVWYFDNMNAVIQKISSFTMLNNNTQDDIINCYLLGKTFLTIMKPISKCWRKLWKPAWK